MDEAGVPATLHLVPISVHPLDCWRLTDPYIEEVWSEHLGPTATLLARRLGRTVSEDLVAVDVDLGEFAAGLGVGGGTVLKALNRLHRFDVVCFDIERSLVGVSGFAPSVRGTLLDRLSEHARSRHHQLVAESDSAPQASVVVGHGVGRPEGPAL